MANNTIIRTSDVGNYVFTDNVVDVSDVYGTKNVLNSSVASDILNVGSTFDTVEIGSVGGFKDVKLQTTRVTAPFLTPALIDAGDDKTLATKEWVSLNGSGIPDADSNGLIYVRRDAGWEQPALEITGNTSTSVGIGIENTSVANSISLPLATDTLAGLMSATDKTKLDSSGATDLSYSRDATTVTVKSSTGVDTILPSANNSLAGVLTAEGASKIGYLPEQRSSNIDVSYSPGTYDPSNISAIVSTSVKDFKGYSFNITLSAGTFSQDDPINFFELKNANIVIEGDGISSTIIDDSAHIFTFAGGMFRFLRCSNVNVEIRNMRFNLSKFQYPISSVGSINVSFKNCYFDNSISTTRNTACVAAGPITGNNSNPYVGEYGRHTLALEDCSLDYFNSVFSVEDFGNPSIPYTNFISDVYLSGCSSINNGDFYLSNKIPNGKLFSTLYLDTASSAIADAFADPNTSFVKLDLLQ